MFIRRVGNADDVRWINLNTLEDNPVSSSPNDHDSRPAIDGNLVAWQALRSGSSDILAAVLGSPPFVVAGEPDNEGSPSVSAGRIAYVRGGDIFVYTHATGQTIQITNDDFQQQHVHLSGNHVLWSDDRNGNQDLFLYDLVDGQTYQLTNHPSDQVPTGIDGNTVVFQDVRFGDPNVFKITFTINHAPVADAGPDQDVFTGDVVQLDGSATDPDGDAIASFQWAFASRPSGSTATLSDASAANPTFVADVSGVYVLSLVASDGVDSSSPATVTVTATERPTPASTPGCAKGAGTLTTNPKARFAFGVTYIADQPAPKGAVGFTDAAARTGIVSIRLTSLIITGTHVRVQGEGRTRDGATVPFRLEAEDRSRTGSLDTFSIGWDGSSPYAAAGTLKQGNILLGCGGKDK